jgi:hypothetical protein
MPGGSGRRRHSLAVRLAMLTPLALGILMAAPQSHAQGNASRPDHLGLVFETDLEFGGSDVVDVYYTDGSTSKINAGQGVTLSLGAHYLPRALPIDFALTAGYKFVVTADRSSNLGLYRVVLKLTGTYELPNGFWVDAGPVWHVSTKLKGDGYVADIPFDDALGVTIGAGWRYVGLSYTNIKYKSPQTVTDVDGSNIGVTLTFKF